LSAIEWADRPLWGWWGRSSACSLGPCWHRGLPPPPNHFYPPRAAKRQAHRQIVSAIFTNNQSCKGICARVRECEKRVSHSGRSMQVGRTAAARCTTIVRRTTNAVQRRHVVRPRPRPTDCALAIKPSCCAHRIIRRPVSPLAARLQATTG